MNFEQFATLINHLGIPALLIMALTTIYKIGKFTNSIETLKNTAKENSDNIKKNRSDYDQHLTACGKHWSEVDTKLDMIINGQIKKH